MLYKLIKSLENEIAKSLILIWRKIQRFIITEYILQVVKKWRLIESLMRGWRLGLFPALKFLMAPALSWVSWTYSFIIPAILMDLEPGTMDSVRAGPYWKWILFKQWHNLIHFQYTCHQKKFKDSSWWLYNLLFNIEIWVSSYW